MADPNQVIWWRDLAGKTVRAAVEFPAGKYGHSASVVLVFEDDTWAAIEANPDGSEHATLSLCGYMNPTLGIADLLSPEELFETRMVTAHQRDHLFEKQANEERAEKQKELDALRTKAEQLQREIDGGAA